MRVPTEQRLSGWLADQLRNLQLWTDPRTGQIFDPFESHQHDAHILAESYSPATALVLAAAGARRGTAPVAALIPGYYKRIVERLADAATPPFTALFLQYFSLLAAADLRALAESPESTVPLEQTNEFVAALCAYQDRLDTPLNANCAAMQAGVQMLRQLHAGQADWDKCQASLDVVTGQQNHSGFINDDLAGPSMPVAYHMFCMYLLAAAICRLDLPALPPEAMAAVQQADSIVVRGYSWIGHLLGNDGMIAQYGRSRYHPFAQAAGVALLTAVGIDADDAAVRRYLTWMDQYRLEVPSVNGTTSSVFAVTPNLCPQAMRVGFEPYGMVSVYNNLAMVILLDAWAWLCGVRPAIPGAADGKRAFLNAARQRGAYGDAQTGLIRLSGRAGYVLVNLLTDHRQTTPLGSLIHLRLGDDLHEKAVAPLFWAEPRVSADEPTLSVWEGAALCDKKPGFCDKAPPAPFIMQGQTQQCQSTPSMLILRGEGPGAEWSRSIQLEPRALQLHWQVKMHLAGKALYAVVPCLLWNGFDQTQLRFQGPVVTAIMAGAAWRLLILDGQQQPKQGHWFLTPHRSTWSVSGVTGRLMFPLTESTKNGQEIEWTLRIEAV